LKKPVSSVRFRFYKQKTEKTEPKQKKTEPNRKNRAKTEKTEPKPEKPSQTGLNRFCPKKPNRTETGQFDPVSVRFRFCFLKNFGLVTFFDNNRTEPKMITPNLNI